MKVPIIGSVGGNGKGTRLRTGKVTPTDTQLYPEGMVATRYEVDGKEYEGIAAPSGRFNYDRVLRLLRLLELYNTRPEVKEPEKSE